MDLKADILRQVLQCLPPKRENERRRAPRSRHGGWVRITLCTGEISAPPPSLDVLVWNLSPRGAGIVAPQPMEFGTQFILHLPHAEAQQVDVLCMVVHCRPKDNALYHLGVEFTCVLPRCAVTDEPSQSPD